MNLDEQDLREFLCDELFYSLFDVAEDTYAQQFGRYVDDNTYKKAKRNFLHNLSSADMSSEDYLRAIYAVESVKEQESLANTDRRFSSRSLRRRISSTLSELYCERLNITEEDPNYESLSMDITNQFSSYLRDVTTSKGPIEQYKSNASVHSLFKSFFDSLERAYEYEPITKGKKRRVLRCSKKRLKLSDPSKKLKRLMIPLVGVALAGALHSVGSNATTVQPEVETTPIVEASNSDLDMSSNPTQEAQEVETPQNHEYYSNLCNQAIEFLYQNPNYLSSLDMPDQFVEDFKQYLAVKNRLELNPDYVLSEEDQDKYNELRYRIVDELVEKKVSDVIFSIYGADAQDLDLAGSNGYRFQAYYNVNNENYSSTFMSGIDLNYSQTEKQGNIFGSYGAKAISRRNMQESKDRSWSAVESPRTGDDLDIAIENATVFYGFCICTPSDDKTIAENLNPQRIQEFTNLIEKTNERDSAER